MNEGILFGLIAMLGWGTADFLAAFAVRKKDVFKTVLWSQITSLVLFTILLLAYFPTEIPSPRSMIILIASGFLSIIAYLSYYKAMQVGKIGVVVPITSLWAGVTVILGFFFLKEKIIPTQWLGILLALTGTFLVSLKIGELKNLKIKTLSKGINFALIAMVIWGVYFIPMKMLIPELGWFLPIFYIKLFSSIFLAAYALLVAKDFTPPYSNLKPVLGIGLLETIAFTAFGLGISSEYVSIVSPVAATFPIATILLSRIFFKEKISLTQAIGISIVIIGLALIAS